MKSPKLKVAARLKIFNELLHTSRGVSKEEYCMRLNNAETEGYRYSTDGTCVLYSDVSLVKKLLKTVNATLNKDADGNHHISDE